MDVRQKVAMAVMDRYSSYREACSRAPTDSGIKATMADLHAALRLLRQLGRARLESESVPLSEVSLRSTTWSFDGARSSKLRQRILFS